MDGLYTRSLANRLALVIRPVLMKSFGKVLVCAVLALSALVSASCRPAEEPPADGRPRLVVLLVVDQLRADLLDRYDGLFEGGFRYLRDRGLRFSEAHHGHAGTTTAPGHATIATGCDPARHGVISNYWFDRATGELAYSVEDERFGKSPERLGCSTLGDWLKSAYRQSKVYTISTKDRSAVLLGGRQADAAYWYDREGGFESSSYYRNSEPAWLTSLNEERSLDRHFGTLWEPLEEAAAATEDLGTVDFDLGPLEEDFPHAMGEVSFSPDNSYYSDLVYSPWMDEHVLKIARLVVSEEELGADGFPDLLALGLSTLDAVGHEHGGDSRQVLDVLLRLDRELGAFFDFLDETVGLSNVGIALTADHGSVPLPELRMARGLPGGRAGAEDVVCIQALRGRLQDEFGAFEWLRPGPVFALDPMRPEVTRELLEKRTREILEECEAVERVWLASELSDDDFSSPMERRFARSHHPERSPDFRVQWPEYFMTYRSVPASHGSGYDYDTHVPLVLVHETLSSGVRAQPVETVDLAPTLAEWLGLEVPEGLPGASLEVFGLEPARAAGGSAPGG